MSEGTGILSALRRWSDRTPLADPRSLGGSMAVHALMILAASAAAFSVGSPETPAAPRALRADLGPVDNRAGSQGSGGGGPGELGGDRLAEALQGVMPPSGLEASAARPAPADALIAEILPAPVTSEAIQQALPGPQTSGFGVYPGPGPGAGGGGGSGGGAGGGTGRGTGPGTEFFGTRDNARSFAYVIDCSGSMASRASLDVAKRELLSSLNQLAPDAQFAVVFYNLSAIVLTDPLGHRGLMPATGANKSRVATQLSAVTPDGGTDHMLALRTALSLRPEVVFFLTDADLMTQTDVSNLLAEVNTTRIQAVEFGRGVELRGETNPLRRLANGTGGMYRYVDVTRFPKPQ